MMGRCAVLFVCFSHCAARESPPFNSFQLYLNSLIDSLWDGHVTRSVMETVKAQRLDDGSAQHVVDNNLDSPRVQCRPARVESCLTALCHLAHTSSSRNLALFLLRAQPLASAFALHHHSLSVTPSSVGT